MPKIRHGNSDVARIIYSDPTFGDIFDSADSDSIQSYSFQTTNFELFDADFGILDSRNYRGAVEGISNTQAHGAGNGTRWIVGASPADDFAAFSANQIVRSNGTIWIAEPNAKKGTLSFRKDTSAIIYFNHDTFASGSWVLASSGASQDYRESVKSNTILTPPGSPANGDRYLIGEPTDTATGAWVGHEGEITYYNTSATRWEFEARPNKGTQVFVESTNHVFIFDNDVFASGAWNIWGIGIYTEGNGIDISGNSIAASLAASGGLKFSSGQITIEPNDFAGSGLVDDGSDNLAIDWSTTFDDTRAVKALDLASNSNGKGAAIIGIEDSAGYFAALNVENALKELYESVVSAGVTYTAGSTGVTKGDLVCISSGNLVLPLSISTPKYALGIALSDAATTETVRVLANDTVITGILSGATPGDRYYWNGTAWQTNIPTTSGTYVWAGGVAKNATDLHVEVNFVKRNA